MNKRELPKDIDKRLKKLKKKASPIKLINRKGAIVGELVNEETNELMYVIEDENGLKVEYAQNVQARFSEMKKKSKVVIRKERIL